MTETATGLLPAKAFNTQDRDAVYRAIMTRRDTRGEFLSDPVPDEVLARILVAAHHAPSVGFMQPWSFTVLRDQKVKARVHEAFVRANAEAALMFPEEKQATYRSLKLEGIIEAPVNICITCDRQRAGKVVIGRTHIPIMDLYSSVCAVQNLWLAARAEGLGVGWVSILDQNDLRQALDIPRDIIPVAYLCLGHVAGYHDRPELEKAGWLPRLPLDSLINLNGWNGRPDEDFLSAIRQSQAKLTDTFSPAGEK